ncbi:Plasma membrane t-SNARE, secretory vesicle fusion [Allomyces javanicus]|nr:Plasma membrane t-SNARE, secretory vesicle fusion [Allomyces javanicus]
MSGYPPPRPPAGGNGSGYSDRNGPGPGGYGRPGPDPRYGNDRPDRGGYNNSNGAGYPDRGGYSDARGGYPDARGPSPRGAPSPRGPPPNASGFGPAPMHRPSDAGSMRGPGGGGRVQPSASPPAGGGPRDRMAQLRAAGIQRPMTMAPGANGAGVEMSPLGPGDKGVARFLDDVAAMDAALKRVRNDLQHLDQLHRRAFDAMPDHQMAANQREIDQVTEMTKDVLGRIRSDMAALDKDLGGMTKGTADYVMCANQLVTVKKKYQEDVRAFHAAETAFQQRQRDRMLREMRIVQPDATDADVDEYMASGGQIFAQQVLHSSRYGEARRALQSVQDRHAELQAIERTVEELAQLFLDLNTLIEQQDYTITQITEHVEETVVELEKGEKEIEKAVEIRKNSIKWSWYLCACVIVIIVAVAVYLFVFGPFSYLIFGNKDGAAAAVTTTTTVAGAMPTPTASAPGGAGPASTSGAPAAPTPTKAP